MSGAAQTAPLSVALVAGALVALNPCSLPLLPAFVSYSFGRDARRPRDRGRLLFGLGTGLLLAAAVVAVFAVVGLPLIYGASRVADAVPWTGLAAGIAAILAGLAALGGRHVSIPVQNRLPMKADRSWLHTVLFGVGYGLASLGCSLPVFLAFVAASLAAGGSAAALGVFAAYAAGMAITLVALAAVVALLREGIVRRLSPLVARLEIVSGLLLVLAGAYLTYYWARVRFGDTATLADDPIVGTTTLYSARVQTLAGRLGLSLILALVLATGLVIIAGLWQVRNGRRATAPTPSRGPS